MGVGQKNLVNTVNAKVFTVFTVEKLELRFDCIRHVRDNGVDDRSVVMKNIGCMGYGLCDGVRVQVNGQVRV